MRAKEHLKAGELDAALGSLQDEIRRQPANTKYRVFLFQLLAVLGQWERALNQLKVIGELDATALPMVHTYREALRCEMLRARVFAGKASPVVFGEPTRWLALLIEALRLSAVGDHEKALPLREEAFELAPATAGTLDGVAFEWIADADARLGPVLEAIMNGGYYWVPFERIRAIRIAPPEDLRDMVWAAAEIDWPNGGTGVALVPSRYAGSEHAADKALSLARSTIWEEPTPGVFTGLGQRILATDTGEYPLLEIRAISLATAATAATADAGANPTTEAAAGAP